MKIDNSNYEIWIIDWLDGNLTDLQVEQLLQFLYQNPDLKEEFNEVNSLCLKPYEKLFPQKDQLKKSTADLSGSQFEYLCVAYLENDLSKSQQTELTEIIGKYPEKKRAFELVQKMRLVPSGISYNFKYKLKKRTLTQNVIRLSAIGLCAAASFTLIIFTYNLIPRSLPDKINSTTFNILVDSSLLKLSVATVSEKTFTEEGPVITKLKREMPNTFVQKNSPVFNQSDPAPSIPVDLLVRNTDNPEIPVIKITVYSDIVLKENNFSNTLVASRYDLSVPVYDDERSKLSKFIARTFREKILKENVSKDDPLKAYEIAEAGVTGLNKLLGWEMALVEKKDSNGELASVYFSSKILKFNAPVKKTGPLQ